jgi:hypothetical protein
VTAVAIQFAGSWHGAFHATWNAIVIAIYLLYVAGVVLAPEAVFPGGRRQKFWWIILAAVPYMAFGGLYIPVGSLLGWAFLLQQYRDARRASQPR